MDDTIEMFDLELLNKGSKTHKWSVRTFLKEHLGGGETMRRRFKMTAFMSILVCLSVVVQLVAVIAHVTTCVNQTQEEFKYCMSCSSIQSATTTNDESRELFERLDRVPNNKTGNMQCCANTETQTRALVKLLSKRLSLKTASSPTPSANLVFPFDNRGFAFAQRSLYLPDEKASSNDLQTSNDGSFLLYIDPNPTEDFHQLTKNLALAPTGIKIIHPGLYFVYNNIKYSAPHCRANVKVFRSLLLRKRPHHPAIALLAKLHTCCFECEEDRETIFSGGVFELKEGDIIQVSTTAPRYMGVTYVGVMMLGG